MNLHSRDRQDEFAFNSQMNAANAIKEGKFKNEIQPVEIKVKKDLKIFDTDEFVRPETTIETFFSKTKTGFP